LREEDDDGPINTKGKKERKKAIEGVPRARGNVGLDQNAGASIKHV